jgi:hypothetical protein
MARAAALLVTLAASTCVAAAIEGAVIAEPIVGAVDGLAGRSAADPARHDGVMEAPTRVTKGAAKWRLRMMCRRLRSPGSASMAGTATTAARSRRRESAAASTRVRRSNRLSSIGPTSRHGVRAPRGGFTRTWPLFAPFAANGGRTVMPASNRCDETAASSRSSRCRCTSASRSSHRPNHSDPLHTYSIDSHRCTRCNRM